MSIIAVILFSFNQIEIREIDSKGGLIVTNKNLKVIADPVIVNFNTKVNDVTNYTEESTGISGYTNGDYGADAAFLGYNDDKSKVKFIFLFKYNN